MTQSPEPKKQKQNRVRRKKNGQNISKQYGILNIDILETLSGNTEGNIRNFAERSKSWIWKTLKTMGEKQVTREYLYHI